MATKKTTTAASATTLPPSKRKPIKRERSTSTKGHYVTNAELLPLIIRDKAAGKLSNELASKLILIAQRYSYSASFSRYSYRDDMVAFAVLNLVNNWHKFDETVTNNPFAFYTTAVYRSFLQYLADEREQRDTRDALLVEAGANPSFSYQERSRSSGGGLSSDDSAFS